MHAYECDITSADSVRETFATIGKDAVGGESVPSILVNAAGYIKLAPLEEMQPEEAWKQYLVNLHGPTLTGQAFARLFFEVWRQRGGEAKGGRIVNVASQAAHVALHQHGPYCASKAGMLGLTRCMASEWGGRGISEFYVVFSLRIVGGKKTWADSSVCVAANSISPGPVWTALGKKAWSDQKMREEYVLTLPAAPFDVSRLLLKG